MIGVSAHPLAHDVFNVFLVFPTSLNKYAIASQLFALVLLPVPVPCVSPLFQRIVPSHFFNSNSDEIMNELLESG